MTAPFEKLKVWQLSHELALQIYKSTANFPTPERYGIISQIRRAAVAVPTNIVEGNARNHRNEYIQYCHVARAMIAEVKYLLRLSFDLGFLPDEKYQSLQGGYNHVGALLQGLIESLQISKSSR